MQTTLPAETVERAIEMIGEGSSVKKASETLNVPFGTLWRALNSTEHVDKYARAIPERTKVLVESILDVADDATIEPKDKAIRVDARKWLASKILPKQYGDRNQIEFPDKDGNPQAVGGILGDTERSARLLFLLEQAEKRSKGVDKSVDK